MYFYGGNRVVLLPQLPGAQTLYLETLLFLTS